MSGTHEHIDGVALSGSTVSLPPRAEALGMFDRFADACLVIGARRWPDDLAELMVREWRAELAALRADHALRSVWTATRFAVSLALSRPVESERPEVSQRRAQAARKQLIVSLTVLIVAVVTVAIDSTFLDFCVPIGFLLGVTGRAHDTTDVCWNSWPTAPVPHSAPTPHGRRS
jgi:hypothetical protein